MTKIAICGAGPAGLTLARLLQNANIDTLEITIFEKDPSPTSRFYQGGTLDLHSKTGLAAIREAGLWDEFSKHARYEGEELVFADKNATVYIHIKEAPQIGGHEARPEIDREKLKDILLQSVNPSCIRWGKKLSGIDADAGTLLFSDGSTEGPFDLVVGADGAWSKVRSAVSAAMPTYSGICGMEGNIDAESAGPRWEAISKLAGQGSYFTYSDGQALMVQRMGNGTLKLGAWLQKQESWPADIIKETQGDETEIKNILSSKYHDWDNSLKQFIAAAHRFRPWPLFELPVGHNWEHRQGWTLIGDSAHLMTPFAGEGVNAAMRDSLDLANAIVSALRAETSLDEAVRSYEQALFPRAKQVQEETARNKNGMFSPAGLVRFLSEMMAVVGKETGHDIDQGWLRWVPIRRTAYGVLWTIWLIGAARRKVRTLIWG